MRPIDADAFDKVLEDAQIQCKRNSGNFRFGVLSTVRANLKNAPTVSGWVSVKDRMPEEKENPLTHDFTEVICFCDFGGRPKRTDIRTYGFGKRCCENEPHFWNGPQIMDGVVTHWMPLPEPPEGSDGEPAPVWGPCLGSGEPGDGEPHPPPDGGPPSPCAGKAYGDFLGS